MLEPQITDLLAHSSLLYPPQIPAFYRNSSHIPTVTARFADGEEMWPYHTDKVNKTAGVLLCNTDRYEFEMILQRTGTINRALLLQVRR